MNYSDLNKTQRRIVDAFIARRPELANASSITRVEIEELWYTMYAERATGGPKMGYPGWLVKGDKVTRGVYPFPAPNVTHSTAPLPKPLTQKQVRAKITSTDDQAAAAAAKALEEEEFFAELAEAGVTTAAY